MLSFEEQISSVSYQMKSVIRPLDPYAVLLPEQIELARWMSDTYHCVLADALRLMLPAELRGGRVKEKNIRTVVLAPQVEGSSVLGALRKKDGSYRAPIQGAVMEIMLQLQKPMSTRDLCAFVPGASGAINALVKKGLLCEENHVSLRDPLSCMQAAGASQPKKLSPQQQKVLDAVCAGLDSRSGSFLLHGVTGSGKTEVYMQAIDKVLREGGGAIVLVPEIALTSQTVERFTGRFGRRVALLHSRLSPGERYDEWRRILLGAASVVIGARSAVFAPLSHLRLIVIDEEHELSYVSETAPRYSAIETAAKRCKLCGAALLLGSATPSLTSYYRALHGRYTLLRLPGRINDFPMPRTQIVDMRGEFMRGNTSIFSAPLHSALQNCLQAGEKAILFINRRGYSTFVSCRGCGYVFKCPACDVSMTYHKHTGRLRCHYCGHSEKQPRLCPSCGKPYIKYFGIGTQQVEEALHEQFPGVRSLRMDLDTTQTKNAHHLLLRRFAQGEAQVLVGTQMIAKGLDIPEVTLVGIVAADATLHIPDFRSAERTFQLTMQVAGRAGRGKKPGEVIIQSYTPAHPAIIYAAAHDYEAFYEAEIQARRRGLFPPFAIFARILFIGEDETLLAKEAEACAVALRPLLLRAVEEAGGDGKELLMLYASPAPVAKRQGAYRYQVLLKLARTKNASSVLQALYAYVKEMRIGGIRHVLEVNPPNLF